MYQTARPAPTGAWTRERDSNFPRSDALRRKSHALIPGGAHTYAKGDDQYPVLSPGFIVRGEGCHVWDADGNEFIEYGMGLRAVTLGHGYRPVVEAAYAAMLDGTNFTRPAVLEIECAETMVDLIQAAEMVKFAKNGSDATTAAVKLARAYTARDMVGVCADQPFFSTDDWFIGSTAMNAGIPGSSRQLTASFKYNDLDSVRKLFAAYPDQIACLVLEPATSVEPTDSFLQQTRELCHRNGALLILDEMITGFRWHLRGGQHYYKVEPDLATFGKGMGNGFSISCLVGRRDVMELGGLQHDRDRVFLLSTTHGGETPALAAALATIEVYRRENVIDVLWARGERLRDGINHAIKATGVGSSFRVVGLPPNLVYVTCDASGRPSQAFRSLFMQEIIRRGILGPSFVVSFSHSEDDIDRTVQAVGDALHVYRRALEDDGVERYLVGRPVQPVFRRRD
jgi:glutamate-1-semialdehyde 2,1-aminomutase